MSDRVRLDMKRIVLAVSVLSALLTVKANAETGLASHYGHGDGFHGLRTASGERFNKMAMTAAHRTRRMGTHVTVTNLANGRSVVVRISDRKAREADGQDYRSQLWRITRNRHGRDGKGIGRIRSIELMVARNECRNIHACDALHFANGRATLSVPITARYQSGDGSKFARDAKSNNAYLAKLTVSRYEVLSREFICQEGL
jgi:hypothetical protein